MTRRARIIWWLRAGGSVAVVAVLLTFVPIARVWDAIRAVNPWVWLAAVVLFITGHAVNAMKLRLLIGVDAVPASACLRAHFTAIASNLGLPGVAGGEVIRVAYLAPVAGTARVAMAAVAERLVDFVVLLLLAVTAASVAGVPPALADGMRTGRRWTLVVAAVCAALVFLFRRRLARSGRTQHLGQAWWAVLARPRALLFAAGLSLAVQTAFVLANAWLGAQAGVSLALAPWFLAWTFAKLSVLLPISLGGIGVREAALVSVLAAYGAPPDGVLAAGILWQGALITGSLTGFLTAQWLTRST